MSDFSSEHEQGLALFISPEWRARFRESLENERLRKKVLFKLDHFSHLDSRFREMVPRAQQRSEFLLPLLRQYGAPRRCYVMSNVSALDGCELSLADALTRVVDDECGSGTFISCLPGKLAYFHDEEQENRWILRRPD